MALAEYSKLHLPVMTALQISFSHSVKVKTSPILTVINYILPCGQKFLQELNFTDRLFFVFSGIIYFLEL